MDEKSLNTIQYLEAARTALVQQQDARIRSQEQDELVGKLDRNLDKERASLEECIAMMKKKRRSGIEENYRKQTEDVQKQLKKVRASREKARQKGVKNRVHEETSQLRQETQVLRNELQKLFRTDRVPFFCNTWVYYALHYPRSVGEIAFFLLYLAVVLAGIPLGIWWFLTNHGIGYLILIYLVDILVFGGLHLLVTNLTKVKHHETLKQGRQMRTSIAHNRRTIRTIEKGIRKDTNETMYGLGEFDEKIQVLEKELDEIYREQTAALNTFDTETSAQIRREIEKNNEERMRQLEEDLADAEKELEARKKDEMYWGRRVNEKFGNDLGSEFMELGKLDQLIDAFHDGATNMMDAQEIVRSRQLPKK